MSYEYYDKLPPPASSRYNQKLKICGLEECPYRLPSMQWKDDPTSWPDITYGDIYHYLVESPGPHTRQSMKAHKSLDSKRFFLAGWVHTVLHLITSLGVFIFQAKVTPSYRVNDPPHNPWVAAASDGSVITAHCDCKAGLGESCSHVGALLFKIEAAVRNGIFRPACTDLPCEWNGTSMKKVPPSEVSDIDFYSDVAKSKIKGKEAKRRRLASTPPSETEQEDMLKAICMAQSVKPVALSLFSETIGNFFTFTPVPSTIRLPSSLRELHDTNITNMAVDLSAISSINLSQQEIDYLNKVTESQGGSTAWIEQRLGRITASKVRKVLRTDQQTPSPSVILSVTAPSPDIGLIPSVRWGRDHEATALRQFQHSSGHDNLKITKTGLIIHSKKQFIGASCDGLMKCDCCGEGCLEIKCPHAWKDNTIAEMSTNQSSYLTKDLTLKKDHPYEIYEQIQTQMFVTGRAFTILFVWVLRDSCAIRDNDFMNDKVPILELFWRKHIMPELLTRHLENGQETVIPSTDDAVDTLYCYCQQPESDEMVGCDSLDCPFNGWIHFKCAGLKRKPRSKTWFCRSCRRK